MFFSRARYHISYFQHVFLRVRLFLLLIFWVQGSWIIIFTYTLVKQFKTQKYKHHNNNRAENQ